MLQNYANYYQHFGIRRALKMAAPTLVPVQRLSLPRQAVLHFLPEGNAVGIAPDDYLLHDIVGSIYVEHVLQLADNHGNPKHTSFALNALIRGYHRKYRRVRQLHNLDRALNDPKSLIVENYAVLAHAYRYAKNLYSGYNKWWNIQATLWKHMADIAKQSDRPQFLRCSLPTLLPSRSLLNRASTTMTTKTLALFPEHASLFILELWKWLGENRASSVMGKLDADTLSKINLIWVESGSWFVINLGLLDKWRQTSEAEQKNGVAKKDKALDPDILQRRFLRMLMFLHEVRTTGGDAKGLIDGVEEVDNGREVIETGVDITLPVDEHDDTPEKIELEPGMDLSKLPLDAIEETEENIAKIDAIIAKDLDALEHLHVERELAMDRELTVDIPAIPDEESMAMLDIPALQDVSLSQAIMAKAEQLADVGEVSAAEYRRFEALSKAHAQLVDPFTGEGKLVEKAVIHPAELGVSPIKLAPAIPGLVDESMLHSSLAEFDAKYISKVMRKDIVNAVLNVQRAGVAITGYTVKEHRDAMGHQEEHHIQLTPVKGRQSTFSFKIPKVAEDGTFMDNGVKYFLSKQRSDNPIRKINSSTVALFSQYGKVHVSRSEKKTANYAQWLVNQVRARGMSADSDISEMMLGNVYNPNHRVPRVYSMLAQSFRSFTHRKARLFFDYAARSSFHGPDGPISEAELAEIEKGGMVYVGRWTDHDRPIVVGPDNVFYYVNRVNGEIDLVLLGSIETMLGLDTAKAPMEVAEIKIFGKLMPVGLFLAYHLGFRGMLSTLGTSWTRSVPAGERLALTGDEYAIRFEDVAYVFERNNDKASLILQGLAGLSEVTSSWPSSLYEKKSVYYNVLDRLGLGVRYVREMEMLVDLFVDPISREILLSMNEPVTFIGLVIRACEMLLTDWSRDETDLEDSRVRGYERIPGAIYRELVKGISVHRARGVSNAAIEISPYAVRTALMQDNALRLVEESNPIHELKGQEELTFSGTGGRSGRSMVASSRIFHENDSGLASEATKDSADVAITVYMTANPLLKNVRGLTSRYQPDKSGISSAISTSALLAPGADHDDLMVRSNGNVRVSSL